MRKILGTNILIFFNLFFTCNSKSSTLKAYCSHRVTHLSNFNNNYFFPVLKTAQNKVKTVPQKRIKPLISERAIVTELQTKYIFIRHDIMYFFFFLINVNIIYVCAMKKTYLRTHSVWSVNYDRCFKRNE